MGVVVSPAFAYEITYDICNPLFEERIEHCSTKNFSDVWAYNTQLVEEDLAKAKFIFDRLVVIVLKYSMKKLFVRISRKDAHRHDPVWMMSVISALVPMYMLPFGSIQETRSIRVASAMFCLVLASSMRSRTRMLSWVMSRRAMMFSSYLETWG